MFGPVLEDLFNKVNNIFDPHKKLGVDLNYVKQHIRHEYSIKSLSHLALIKLAIKLTDSLRP